MRFSQGSLKWYTWYACWRWRWVIDGAGALVYLAAVMEYLVLKYRNWRAKQLVTTRSKESFHVIYTVDHAQRLRIEQIVVGWCSTEYSGVSIVEEDRNVLDNECMFLNALREYISLERPLIILRIPLLLSRTKLCCCDVPENHSNVYSQSKT